MGSSRTILAGLLLTVAVGCGTHQHKAMGTALDHKEIFSQTVFAEPMPELYSRLQVAETVMGEHLAKPLETGEKGYAFSRKTFDRVLGEILRETRGFQTVAVAGGGGSDGSPGLVLQVHLDAQGVTFKKWNSNMGWGIAGWVLGVLAIPVQWIHDEVYGLDFRGRVIISDGETGDVLQEIGLGDCSAEDALNFHERTSSFVPYLLTNVIPPTAVSPDPDSILEALLPAALGPAMANLREGFEAIAAMAAVDRYSVYVPDSSAVTIEILSPVDGEEVKGDSVDLKFELVFPEDCEDLEKVEVNGEVELRNDPRFPIPVKQRVPLEKFGVSPVDGEIRISVTLRKEIRPIVAVISVKGGL